MILARQHQLPALHPFSPIHLRQYQPLFLPSPPKILRALLPNGCASTRTETSASAPPLRIASSPSGREAGERKQISSRLLTAPPPPSLLLPTPVRPPSWARSPLRPLRHPPPLPGDWKQAV